MTVLKRYHEERHCNGVPFREDGVYLPKLDGRCAEILQYEALGALPDL
jgi:hypothetical protein